MIFVVVAAMALAALASLADLATDKIEEELDQLENDLEEELTNFDLQDLLNRLEEELDPAEAEQALEETVQAFNGALEGQEEPLIAGLDAPDPGTQPGGGRTDAADQGLFLPPQPSFPFETDVERVVGGAGSEFYQLTDEEGAYDLSAGAGNDIVLFDGFRGETDLGPGDDLYQSLVQGVPGGADLNAAETVLGGAGDDEITGGGAGFVAEGGAGDDILSSNRTKGTDLGPAELDGGPGDDELTFADETRAQGGEGEDTFTVLPTLTERTGVSQITDFDPAEDTLIIQLDPDYPGPGQIDLAPTATGIGSALLVDGLVAVQLSNGLNDLSAVVLMR
ncbi:MAG: hypothetical protein HKN30_13645 [Sulfitobacter sp.]|nr:hypothetical protein [Sulfitobacter sp.]